MYEMVCTGARDGKERGGYSTDVTNVALTGIKIEESDSQLIPKVPRKFLAR